MTSPPVEQLLEEALASLEQNAQRAEESRGPELAWNDPTERSASYRAWDTHARAVRFAIETIRKRLGDRHELWIESVTHRPPPNRWAHCYCGWWPPRDENGEKRSGDESEELVKTHIEERTGKPYVPEHGLIGPLFR